MRESSPTNTSAPSASSESVEMKVEEEGTEKENVVEIEVEEFDIESVMDLRAWTGTETSSKRWASNRVSKHHSSRRTMSKDTQFDVKKKKLTAHTNGMSPI